MGSYCFAQSGSEKIFRSYVRSIFRNTEFKKLDTLSSIRFLPLSPQIDRRTVYYHQHHDRYFVGLLVNFFKGVYVENHNQYFFAFDAQEQNFVFFWNNLTELQDKTNPALITIEDLFIGSEQGFVFDRKRRNSGSVDIHHDRNMVSGLYVTRIKEINLKEALYKTILASQYFDRNKLIGSSVREFCCCIFTLFTKSYDEFLLDTRWEKHNNPKVNFYIRQISK